MLIFSESPVLSTMPGTVLDTRVFSEGLISIHTAYFWHTLAHLALTTVLWSWYNRHYFVYEDTGDQKEQCTQVHLVKNVAELGLEPKYLITNTMSFFLSHMGRSDEGGKRLEEGEVEI